MRADEQLAEARRRTVVDALVLFACLASDVGEALDALYALAPDTALYTVERIAERDGLSLEEVRVRAALYRLDLLAAAAERELVR